MLAISHGGWVIRVAARGPVRSAGLGWDFDGAVTARTSKRGKVSVRWAADRRGPVRSVRKVEWLKVVRPRRRRTPTAPQVIDIPPQPLRDQRSSFPLTCAANCRARCCSTLALATLTPISVAESLIEHPCKNRSSRIRR